MRRTKVYGAVYDPVWYGTYRTTAFLLSGYDATPGRPASSWTSWSASPWPVLNSTAASVRRGIR